MSLLHRLPDRRTLARLLGSALLLAAASTGQGFQERRSDDERRPNWSAPAVQVGEYGTDPGKLLAPGSVAMGTDNRILVADTGNHRIQVFSLQGKLLNAWGKPGSGPSEFRGPEGIAWSDRGEVYVADSGNRRIQVFSEDGTFLRQWGDADTRPGAALEPSTVRVRGDVVAVVERRRHRVRIFSTWGEPVRTLGAFGGEPGRFRDPADAAWDEAGNLYVADAGNHRIQKFDPSGVPVLQWGFWGTNEGMFLGPSGIQCTRDRIFVADSGNHRIEVFDPSGVFLYQWGCFPSRPREGLGRLHFPRGLSVSPSAGYLAVCEPLDNRFQVFALGNARVAKPVTDLPWWDDYHARLHAFARQLGPSGPAKRNEVWKSAPPVPAALLDADHHAVQYFDVGVRPSASIGRIGGFGSRLGEFRNPSCLVFEGSTGRTIVADSGNRRIQILELPAQGDSTTDYAPVPRVIGSLDPFAAVPPSVTGYDPKAATLDALAVGPARELYVADGTNGVILVFDARTEFRRIVRVPEEARREPREWTGIAATADRKTIYLVDRAKCRVVAFDPEGKFQTAWGQEGGRGPQGFLSPAGIVVDQAGFVYVSDSQLHDVRKFDPAGKLVSRWGIPGTLTIGLCAPASLTMPRSDRILVDDRGNHRGVLYNLDGVLQDFLYKGGSSGPGR